MHERVLAIVVSFNPECASLKRALIALEEQGCDTVVVDNGSHNLASVESLCNDMRSCVLIANEQNLGLGAAHNQGIVYARNQGFTHVLVMDQDSIPLNGMVDSLLRAHKTKSQQQAVSAVGVTYLNADNGAESFFINFGLLKFKRRYCGERDEDGCVAADFLISSGSLFSLDTLDAVGGMDEGLFIDHVDTEWFLRARDKGFQAFGVCDAVMQHGLGENTHRISIGGRQRNVPQHKAFRYYYIFRNSVLLYKRSYTSGLWRWNDCQRLVLIMLMFGLFKSPRRQHLKMMVNGVRDGLKGVAGPMQNG